MAELLEANYCIRCGIATLIEKDSWDGFCDRCNAEEEPELSIEELKDLLKEHIWHTFMRMMEIKGNEVVKMDGHIDLLDEEHLLKLVKDWGVEW